MTKIILITAIMLFPFLNSAFSIEASSPLSKGQTRENQSNTGNNSDIKSASTKEITDDLSARVEDKSPNPTNSSADARSKKDTCLNFWCKNDRITLYTFWLMIFTGVLAFSTIALWVVTKKAANAAQQAASVAERALTVGERAYVFFDKVTNPGFNLAQDRKGWTFGNTGVVYLIENQGKTPAILTEIMHKHVFMLKAGSFQLPPPINIKTERDQKIPAGISIGSYKHYELNYHWIPIDSLEEMISVAQEKTFLFFMGYIRYKDIFKKRHRLGFCAYYDIIAEQFLAIGDEEYNYTKDE